MSPTVLIVGCGIAGPVLAVLLKRKGYVPIVFEKVKELGDAGASLMLMPNGLKVLDLVNVAEGLLQTAFPLSEFCDQTFTGAALGISRVPATFHSRYGQPAAGVKRTNVNLALKQLLIENAIELREGWKLVDIEERETDVIAVFEGDRSVKGSFLIGTDGIKAASRAMLMRINGLKEEVPSYTGLTQTSGISPITSSLQDRPSLLNLYGPSAHFITYPISHSHCSWAITLPETLEAQESWRLYNDAEMVTVKAQLLPKFRDWCTPIPEIIEKAERMLKFGLYDREELAIESWFSARCVLLGDAAHPTSPHLGQGANQALEDCYHLSTLLPAVNFKSAELSTRELTLIFHTFAEKRQPRTAALVKGARAQGERRVCTGGYAACQERDEAVRNQWKNERAVESKYNDLCRQPF